MAESADFDVFVIGSAADREAAKRLANKLRESGLSVFLADDRALDGQDSLRGAEDAMQRSKAIAVLVPSSAAPTGAWLNEVEHAIDRAGEGKSLLIPVFLESSHPSALPLGLRRISGVYARTEDELEAGVAAISRAVQERRDDRGGTSVYVGVPRRPDHYFKSSDVDRALAEVRTALAERDGPVWLTGVAGIGKSVVASEVCRRLSAEVDVIGWITATSEESVVGGFASLAQALGIGHPGDGTLQDHALRARSFLARGSASWLLVLDDVEDETDILNWPPASYSAGTCLVTSRVQPSLPYRHRTVVIDGFSLPEAVQYLREVLPSAADEGSSENELEAIANALGGHPLALRMAVDLIGRQHDADPNQLRKLLAQLTSRQPVDASGSVADTLEAALASVSVRHPVARHLLNAMGWLSNEPFPIEMFRGRSDDPFLSSTPSQITGALEALGRHALVSVDDDDLVSTSHDLIRAFARSLSTDAIGFLLRVMAPAFSNPESPDNWALCTRLYPHVLELSRLIAEIEPLHAGLQREWVELRVGTARYLVTAGSSDDALTLLQQTLADSERMFGSNDPSTLSARSNLAALYQSLGRYEEAIGLLQETLAANEHISDSDHPSTLSARANLASLYSSLGRYQEAAALLEQTLADSERILGSDHRSTLSVRTNLAGIYQSLGRYDEAVALEEQTLMVSERILGSDHPSTLSARNTVAGLYYRIGRYHEAEAMLKQALADTQRIFGREHPSTLTVRANLAGIYQSLGRSDEAVALLEQTLTDSERILGSDHPSTLTVKANLDFVLSHGHND